MRICQGDQATILLQSSHYPLTITVNNLSQSDPYQYQLIEIINGQEKVAHTLRNGDIIKIRNPQVKSLRLNREPVVPLSFTVQQNYPNPFNPNTLIKYTIPRDGKVEIIVYNMLGQKVKTLVNHQQKAGYYSVQWNGTNEQGQNVSSGIYLLVVNAVKQQAVKKMVLLK